MLEPLLLLKFVGLLLDGRAVEDLKKQVAFSQRNLLSSISNPSTLWGFQNSGSPIVFHFISFNTNLMRRCLIFLLCYYGISALSAQNWEQFGETTKDARSFFHDTTNNSLYIGGFFTWFEGLEARGLVKWDGQSFATIGFFPNVIWGDFCDPVNAITRYKGEIYCTLINGPWEPNQIRGLARWNGINWDSIAGIDGIVSDLVVFNEELYIAGGFQMVGDPFSHFIIKWDGENWQGLGFNGWLGEEDPYGGYIIAATFFQGELYVGGNFRSDDGTLEGAAVDVARFDGTQWHTVGSGILGFADDIGDLEVYKGELYACGDFKKSSGNAGNLIMKLKDGEWVDVGGSFQYGFGAAYKMLVYHDKLYVFGNFNNLVGGVPVDNIAIWDGERWCGLGSEFNKGIESAVVYNDSLIIGGGFEYIDGMQIYSLAKWLGGDYLDACGEPVSSAQMMPVLPDDSGLAISPNPATSFISISVENVTTPATLIAHNLLGQPVLQRALPPSNVDVRETVDVSAWPPGVYFFTLRAGGQVWSEKAVIRE